MRIRFENIRYVFKGADFIDVEYRKKNGEGEGKWRTQDQKKTPNFH